MKKVKNKRMRSVKRSYVKSIKASVVRELLLLSKKELFQYLNNISSLNRNDKLLTSSKNVYDAYLNRGVSINECNMPDAYLHAAYILITIIELTNNNGIRDGLIFPALFSFRHYLELTMKDSINRFGNSGLNDVVITREHNLVCLWETLSPHITNGEDKTIIANLINGFNSVDPKGELFRYPYEIGGNGEKLSNSLPHGLRDLKDMKKTMLKIYRFLDGINWNSYENK